MRAVACAMVVICLGCGRLEFTPRADGAGDAIPDGWWDASWTRRTKLVISNPGIALDGFPLLVHLDATRIDFADTQPMGRDVRFTDEGSAVLSYEIEQWDDTSASLWVRIPALAAAPEATVVWLYYGNSNAAAAPDVAATWAGHSLVWHLADTPNSAVPPDITDATSNDNAGTSQGGMPAGAQGPGQIAGSLVLDGTNDWITAPRTASLAITGDLTLAMWINRSAVRYEWLCDFNAPVSEEEMNNHLYELTISGTDRLELMWEYGAGNDEQLRATAPLVTGTNTWMHLAATRDTTTKEVRFFENGVQLGGTLTYVNDVTGGTSASLYVGGEVDATSTKLPFAGRMDELRITPAARSPDWIRADYRSMTDTLITYGAPESL